MANTTYQSPVINTLPKGITAMSLVADLLMHVVTATAASGYPLATQIVSFDYNITTPNVFTITFSRPLPSLPQIDRYTLTQV